ncbi:MAG: hypothetical protein KZQ60_15615 [Candidatus Thiodiazotropha sp. (ex Lucinoma aequizonata)]|nr:hypothetical protein [Candidatus Thiodiazotropha sp. (ex Lucinoma aequizonata)]
MHYSIMTTSMTLRRLGCALCIPFISPFQSPFRPYKRAYAYRGLTAFAPLSMAVSGGQCYTQKKSAHSLVLKVVMKKSRPMRSRLLHRCWMPLRLKVEAPPRMHCSPSVT